MARPRLRHRIEHTRNKHSRAIYRGNTIIIRLARNLSRAEEQEHISNLLRRMTQLVLEEKKRTVIDPFRYLLAGGQSLTVRIATGKTYHFTLVPGDATKATRRGNHFRVTISPQVRRKSLHRFLWSMLAHAEKARIEELVYAINRDTVNVRIKKIHFRFATSQWGSCSSRGTIMLNVALLLLPPSLLRYVVIHELAHRLHANHSPAYWREVENVLPNFDRAYRHLQEYRLPSE